jgi:peptide/nickel transport system ATP-binding protein
VTRAAAGGPPDLPGDSAGGPAGTACGQVGELVLQVQDLVVDYRAGRSRHRALDGVSIDMRQGERLGIVGESGSGKSTLGRVVAGLVTPTSGSLARPGDGRATAAGQARHGSVQIVLQESANALDPRMRVDRAIAEALAGNHRITREHLAVAAQHLERVGLPAEYARKRPRELSGGEKQRVAIARALAAGPRLLVCDEVTSALDVSVQATIVNLLMDLHDNDGMEILFISHDMAVIGFIATRVVVLNGGRVVEQGPTAEVISRPANEYTRQLIAAIPGAKGAVQSPVEGDRNVANQQ